MSNAVLETTAKILTYRPIGGNKKPGTNQAVADDQGRDDYEKAYRNHDRKAWVGDDQTRGVSAVGWCDSCGMKVRMVTAKDASRLAQVTPRTIYRWAEAGQLHFTESQDGLLLICLKSLG
jgi:hypothetical protein